LREAFHWHALQAVERERFLRETVARLRRAGLDAILVKGWASARHYPEPGLRPYGDLDLCVEPGQVPAVRDVLLRFPRDGADIDLHAGAPDLPDRTWDELYRRSRLVPLGDVGVRVPGPEDHLRLTCLHLVRHGGCAPLGLCDVAVALESLPAGFDWDYCLRGRRPLTDQVLCVIGLACRLLHARAAHPVVATAAARLPRWFEAALVARWGAGRWPRPFGHYLRHPIEALRELSCRGCNPIRAVFWLGLSPYTHLPLPLVQLGAFAHIYAGRVRRSLATRLRWKPAEMLLPVHQ
jgi:hypothetical protein